MEQDSKGDGTRLGLLDIAWIMATEHINDQQVKL